MSICFATMIFFRHLKKTKLVIIPRCSAACSKTAVFLIREVVGWFSRYKLEFMVIPPWITLPIFPSCLFSCLLNTNVLMFMLNNLNGLCNVNQYKSQSFKQDICNLPNDAFYNCCSKEECNSKRGRNITLWPWLTWPERPHSMTSVDHSSWKLFKIFDFVSNWFIYFEQ